MKHTVRRIEDVTLTASSIKMYVVFVCGEWFIYSDYLSVGCLRQPFFYGYWFCCQSRVEHGARMSDRTMAGVVLHVSLHFLYYNDTKISRRV